MLDFVEAPRPRSPLEFKWDDTNVARAIELWRLNLSASQIATEIGAPSRSAVLGRIHREQRKEFSADLVRRKPAHAPRKRGDQGGGALKAIRRNKEMPLMPEPKVADHAPDESTLCLITELEYGACRWPIDRDGQRWFCGAPQDATHSYCAFHHRKSIQPARPAQSRGPFRLFK